METTTVCWDYTGIMEKKMETIRIIGGSILGLRVKGFCLGLEGLGPVVHLGSGGFPIPSHLLSLSSATLTGYNFTQRETWCCLCGRP